MRKTIKKGDFVAYAPTGPDGSVYEVAIGRVKGFSEDGKAAFVWYHSGETAARTPLMHLHPIVNNMNNIYRGE